MGVQLWTRVPGSVLLRIVNVFTAVALIFEGYNQGVMGSVTNVPDFIAVMGLGADGNVTNPTKQGGLVAAYYFGAMFGCFFGGWFGDKYGRKKGVWLGSLFCILGGTLMAASQNANMFICARVIAGIGIGFINTITCPWISELAKAHSRGVNFAIIFIANYVGIVIAYWINFGVRADPRIVFRWRFPLAFTTVPVLIVAFTVFFIPESPRWLIANHRREEAIMILTKIRGDIDINDAALAAEIEELEAVVEASRHKRNRIWNIAFGRYSGRLHLGRRAWMGCFLQQLLQWSGILAITTWSNELFLIAGFSPYKSAWMGGFVNTLGGIVGTAAAVLVIDRWGRIKSLLTGFTIQGIALFITAACLKQAQVQADHPDKARQLGTVSAAMLFVFLWFFCMFIIIPCFLYPTEIWPQECRAQGYAFTIFGWAVSCGMTTLLIPIMLNKIGYGTFVLFGCMNAVAIPIIWFLYPETMGRSLEEINLLFAADSLLVTANHREYLRMLDEAGGQLAVAERRLLDSVDRDANEHDDRAGTADFSKIEKGEKGQMEFSEVGRHSDGV